MTFDLAIAHETWLDDALCAQVDPEIFFPEKGGSTRSPKAVCGNCLVRDQCLNYALDHDERFGIWGGMSERDRRQLKKDKSKECAMSEPTHVEEVAEDDAETVMLPDYAIEIGVLLAETEGHGDPFVRELRKIVIQASLALRTGHSMTSGSGAPGALPAPLASATPGPEPLPGRRRSSASVVLMRDNAITAGEVREWCHRTGRNVSARGSISIDTVREYLEAKQAVA